jgi:hypothetical protein
MPSAGQQQPDQTPEATVNRENIPTLWWAILVAYLILFVVTTWIAFFSPDNNPILDENFAFPASDDETLKTAILETIKAEAEEHSQTRSLATTAFNVVLGALLGFLSGSAASRGDTPRRPRGRVTEMRGVTEGSAPESG